MVASFSNPHTISPHTPTSRQTDQEADKQTDSQTVQTVQTESARFTLRCVNVGSDAGAALGQNVSRYIIATFSRR